MTQYIIKIKHKLASQYKFKPSRIENGEPCFDDLPDGDYPMKINGKLDKVKIVNGGISCCNFK